MSIDWSTANNTPPKDGIYYTQTLHSKHTQQTGFSPGKLRRAAKDDPSKVDFINQLLTKRSTKSE